MNERFKELALEAGAQPTNLPPNVTLDWQKFAELIVRECADIADRRPNVLINQTVGGWIKEHFGVKS